MNQQEREQIVSDFNNATVAEKVGILFSRKAALTMEFNGGVLSGRFTEEIGVAETYTNKKGRRGPIVPAGNVMSVTAEDLTANMSDVLKSLGFTMKADSASTVQVAEVEHHAEESAPTEVE